LEWTLLALLILSSAVMAIAPWLVMSPERPQSPVELQFAYLIRTGWGSALSLMALGAGALLCLRRWSLGGLSGKLLSVPALIILGLSVFVANTNMLEEIFRPLESVGYVPAAEAGFLEPDNKLLRAERGGGARAFPLRLLTYHHVVNTTVGGEPTVVTWCSVRQGAAAYQADLEPGKALTFRLAGFGNGNLLLEDNETRTWWRQESGEAILGPLVGRKLTPLPMATTSLARLRESEPALEVLRPSADSTLAPEPEM
jgi:hypothetical protein